jgi:hypothetical protein
MDLVTSCVLQHGIDCCIVIVPGQDRTCSHHARPLNTMFSVGSHLSRIVSHNVVVVARDLSHLASHSVVFAAGTWTHLHVSGKDTYYLKQPNGTSFEVLVRKDAEYFNLTRKSGSVLVVSYKPGDMSYCSSAAPTSAPIYPRVRTRR